MPDPQALYNAVKSGQVQLTDLNDSGKEALKGFMNQRTNDAFVQKEQTFGAPNLNPSFAPVTKQITQDTNPVQQPQSLADKAQSFNAPDANGNLRTNYPLGFLNPLNDINRIENSPIMKTLQHGAGQAMGLQPSDIPAAQSTGSKFVDSIANIVGQGSGYLTNPAQIEQNVGNVFFNNPLVQKASSKVGSLIGSKLPQNAFGRAVANTAEQATVGALGSAAYAPTQTLNSGQNPQDIPQNMLQQGITGAALGGAGGALGSLAKSGLSAIGQKYAGTTIGDALNSFFNKTEAQPQAPQGQLALPPASAESMARYNQMNGNVLPPNTDPIYGQGNIYKPEPLGLPEPNLAPPTSARIGTPVNSSQGLYEQLTNEVNSRIASGDIKPIDTQGYASLQNAISDGFSKGQISHEDYLHMQDIASQELAKQRDAYQQNVQSIYSQMAPKEAPPLEQLMKEAYPNQKPIPSDLVQRAKDQQAARNVAGVDLPVKSIDQRYSEANNGNRLGVTGRVAEPQTMIKFDRKPSDKVTNGVVNTTKEKSLNADVQPTKLSDAKPQDAVVQTKEPRIRDKVYNALDQAEQAARARIQARGTTLNSLPVGEFTDHSIILAAKIGKGTIKLADATEYLVKQFGEQIRPHAKDILFQARNIVKETEKNVVNKEKFNKVEDNPTLPNTASQIQSKTIKEKTSFGDKVNQAYINTVDNVHRLNQFDKAAKEANNGTLRPSDSAHKLALNARNHDMQARQILEHNMIDRQGNATGDSLKTIAKQIPAKDLSKFEDYQVAKHAITRMGRGEKVYKDNMNMTVQKAQMIVDNFDKTNPEFKVVNDQYQKFDGQLGQNWLVDTGMLKQSQWDQYKQDNPNYTPNNRIFSDLEKNSKFSSKGGFTDQSKPIKQAEGSQRQIVSPLESRIEHVAQYTKTAKQNEVGQAIVRSLQKNPDALKGWAEIVHDGPKVDAGEILKNEGPSGLMDHIAQTLDAAKQKPDLTKGNIVSVLMNGEVVHLRINDPQFLTAVGNLSTEAQPKWIEAVGKVTHVMKSTTTGVNPVFGLTRNIWKDIPHAYIASKSTNNPLVFGKDLIGALIDVIGNKEAYQSYKNIGGGHSSSLSADRNLLAQSKEKLVPSTGIGQTLKRNLITKPYHKLENFNNAIETAPRLAEYNRIVRKGGGTYDSKVEGLHQANDLTTNFNKRGNYVKQLDSLVPYLNASVQGLDQLVRMFKTNPVAASIKATMAISVPTAILYAVNHNDPNYQQMSNYIKDNNFLIPNGDGTFTKIPKPREMGMVFGSLIERAMRQWNDQDPQAFQSFGSDLIQNFAPPGIGGAIQGAQTGILNAPLGALRDSIAGPAINLGLNKDFANRPIVPQDLAKLSPKLQVDAKTSEPAKFIGNLTNTSPKQLDYLAKSYLGGVASLGVPSTTKGGSIGNTLKQQVTADPIYSNDIGNNFYNAKAQQDQAKLDSKATGIPPTRDLSGFYDKVATNISALRKQEKLIQANTTMSQTDKNAKLKEIQVTMNRILKVSTIK